MKNESVDTTKSLEDRIAFLRQCNNLYETTGKSPITDVEYDDEYYAIQEINPNHEFFDEVGGLEDGHIYGDIVAHDIVMGSLNKSKNIDEFKAWLINTYPQLNHKSRSMVMVVIFYLQYKVDGLSLSLLYKKGKLVRVLTRGNGFKGVDVTKNAMYVENIRQTISCKEDVEVRGECYKDRNDFYRDWVGEYKNPRNFTSGSINQKDPKITQERGLSFIAYDIVRKQFATESDKRKFLKEENFNTFGDTEISIVSGTINEIVKQVADFMESIDRNALPYDIDGIVVKLDDIRQAQEMGTTNEGKRPKSNRAVKFPCEQKKTSLLDVEWGVGRLGQLSPVGLLAPVELAGTTVKRVSLHNIKFIKKMNLQIGCELLLQKSGDIIPYVVRKEKDGDSPVSIPSVCPSCSSPIEWDATETTKVCKNSSCPAQLNAVIEHWFKKLEVKGIGEGIISELTSVTDHGVPLVSKISDMYELGQYKHIFEGIFGVKAFANIQESVNSVKKVSLDKFIEALGIGKIGTMAKEITAIAPTPQAIDQLTVADITAIQGFADIKAKAFLDGWKGQRGVIQILLTSCIELEEKKFASAKLAGKSFCFTGSFDSPTRGEMEKIVESNGGKNSGVSKNLTALVWDGEIMGGKMEKAKKLGLPIITQKDFLKMLE